MKLTNALGFVALAACGSAGEAMVVNVEMPLAASDVKSIEIFAVRANKLAIAGQDACAKFFKDELENFTSDASTIVSFDAAAGQTSDLRAPPGVGYVVFARGWNVDLVATPDAPKQVRALGCVSDVKVAANKATSFDIKMCLVEGLGSDPICPMR